MMTDLRRIVAGLNEPAKVWRREERFDVELVCDDRLEW
jgi:ferric-chelate reductase